MNVVTQATTCGLLVVIFSGTLIKLYRGTGYKSLVRISAFLLAANAFYTVNALTLGVVDEAFYRGNSSNVLGWILTSDTCWGLGELCFYSGYWVLAIYYCNLARNIPLVISYRGEGKPPIKDYKPLLVFGLIPNIIFPLMESIFASWNSYLFL